MGGFWKHYAKSSNWSPERRLSHSLHHLWILARNLYVLGKARRRAKRARGMKVEEEKSETEKSERKGRKRRKKDGNQAENMWVSHIEAYYFISLFLKIQLSKTTRILMVHRPGMSIIPARSYRLSNKTLMPGVGHLLMSCWPGRLQSLPDWYKPLPCSWLPPKHGAMTLLLKMPHIVLWNKEK